MTIFDCNWLAISAALLSLISELFRKVRWAGASIKLLFLPGLGK